MRLAPTTCVDSTRGTCTMRRARWLIGFILLMLFTAADGKDFAFTWLRKSVPAPIVPDSTTRWSEVSPEVLLDKLRGLQWTRQVAALVSWDEAKQHCDENPPSAESGWRLPSVDELSAIYDADAAPKLCFTNHDGTNFYCKTSELFDLGTEQSFFWSGTLDGDENAWQVSLANGHRFARRRTVKYKYGLFTGTSVGGGGLCVRP
jgi:hypothetical protein